MKDELLPCQEYLRKCGFYHWEINKITTWNQAHKLVSGFPLKQVFSRPYGDISETIHNHKPFFNDDAES